MKVTYTLNEADMLQYYRDTITADNREINYNLWRFRLLGIFTAAMIMVLMKGSQTSMMIAAIILVLWLIISFTVARKFFVEQHVSKIIKQMKFDFREMTVTVSDKAVVVNGNKRELKDYSTFSSCMMLFLKDGKNILIPFRAFNDDVNQISEFIDHLSRQGG